MSRALATIALLILSNTFMTLAWYGHIAFKSKIERFGMLSIILLSWGIALFDPPVLRYLPTPDMACSGYIERLFSNSFVTFDTESGTIKVRK